MCKHFEHEKKDVMPNANGCEECEKRKTSLGRN